METNRRLRHLDSSNPETLSHWIEKSRTRLLRGLQKGWMKMGEYNLYSEFDIEKHKAKYVNYLEVVIDSDGKVMYAVPSHQEKCIYIACKKLDVTRDELYAMCPMEFYGDFMRWLCKVSGAMAVWNERCEYWAPTNKQIGMLRRLKLAGLYKGVIPNTSEKSGG